MRSEASWASGARKRHETALAALCAFCWGEKTRPLFLADQGKQPAINLLKPYILPLAIDLPQYRCVKRCFRRRATWRTPQALDLHRFDHRYAVHRFLGFAENLDRGFDLA